MDLKLTNIIFATMLVSMTGYFICWGLGYTHYSHPGPLLLATLFGVFMVFSVDGSDIANSFGTNVGSGTLTIPQALLIVAMFEVSDAVTTGGKVTDTIRKGIVDLNAVNLESMQFVYAMISALLVAALWLLFAPCKGLPVSTAHVIVDGITGSVLHIAVIADTDAGAMVRWDKLGEIAASWVLSPVLGNVVSLLVFSQIKKYILDYNTWANGTLKGIKQKEKACRE